MTKTKMPATEAAATSEKDFASYELAFHVLPTVAEGEVANVFQKLKDAITKHGGTILVDESPVRFDLAFEVVKYLEGRNRKFSSAYFGWIRFSIDPAQLTEINDVVKGTKELLRHLIIKLTKTEEANPFFFQEVVANLKQVQTIEIDEEEIDGEVEGEEKVEEVVDGEEVVDAV